MAMMVASSEGKPCPVGEVGLEDLTRFHTIGSRWQSTGGRDRSSASNVNALSRQFNDERAIFRLHDIDCLPSKIFNSKQFNAI
jgi:hypothetical protein